MRVTGKRKPACPRVYRFKRLSEEFRARYSATWRPRAPCRGAWRRSPTRRPCLASSEGTRVEAKRGYVRRDEHHYCRDVRLICAVRVVGTSRAWTKMPFPTPTGTNHLGRSIVQRLGLPARLLHKAGRPGARACTDDVAYDRSRPRGGHPRALSRPRRRDASSRFLRDSSLSRRVGDDVDGRLRDCRVARVSAPAAVSPRSRARSAGAIPPPGGADRSPVAPLPSCRTSPRSATLPAVVTRRESDDVSRPRLPRPRGGCPLAPPRSPAAGASRPQQRPARIAPPAVAGSRRMSTLA